MLHISRRTITLSLLVAGLGSAAASAPANAATPASSLPAVQLASAPQAPALLLPAVQSAREAARR